MYLDFGYDLVEDEKFGEGTSGGASALAERGCASTRDHAITKPTAHGAQKQSRTARRRRTAAGLGMRVQPSPQKLEWHY